MSVDVCSSDLVASGGVDGLEDQPASRDAEPGAAVLLGDEGGQIAGLGQVVDEGLGILTLGVERAPVLAGVALADLGDAVPQRALLVGEGEVDDRHGSFPLDRIIFPGNGACASR